MDPINTEEQHAKIVAEIRTIFDPEIPVDVYELGLIYAIDIKPDGVVNIQMTLTAPNCPSAIQLPNDVKAKVAAVPGVTESNVNVVWEPAWTQDRMSEAAKLKLGLL